MKNEVVNSVSVIIPTFNRLNKVKRAIESAISQSHKPLEVIVIDDGSDADMKHELKPYLSSNGLALIELEHSGNPGYLRKVGIGAAKGEWVAFLDDDDYWHPEKLAVQLRIAQSTNVSFISTLSGSTLSREQLFSLGNEVFKQISRRSMLRQNLVTNSSVLVRKSLLQRVGGYADSELVIGAEDYATWLRLLDETSLIMVLENLTFYDQSSPSDQLSKKYSNRYIQNVGIFDYVDWAQNNTNRKFIFFRILLKFARLSI